ncbi:increased DNA methylation 1-like protein [Tanacetum coccineum]
MSLHDYALELKLKNKNLANNDDGVCRVCETGGHVLCGGCRILVRIECLSETGTSREVLCQKCAKKHVGPNSAKKIAKLRKKLQAVLLHVYYAGLELEAKPMKARTLKPPEDS